ncbi:N-acetylmuramoyl-L-alanine amidase [Fischerella sp. JS2]|uniref:N-acetylmuramoyl-L-alanine amidase n=1 Tax=Fischerella sp. JS2 TaxID=2597771 RepID=UPI0028E487B9|nr:N-acetylmuramoyl-L-alanine amidase [Fischerella sp. JS2]
MKFGIDIGHNCPPDIGATGIKQEDDLTKAVGEIVIQNLQKAGYTVVNCTPSSATSVDDSLRKRVNKANQANVDFYVSIHFNKFNGIANGTEVYAISPKAREVADKVLDEIVELGFRDRGVKTANYYVLKNTDMPAILIECCFCDSANDMTKYHAQTMADAITKGLIGNSQTNKKPQTLMIKTSTFLKPSTEQVKDLPKESCIKIEPGTYPILDAHFEEGHYLVEWPVSSKGNRREHFVFAGHSEVK